PNTFGRHQPGHAAFACASKAVVSLPTLISIRMGGYTWCGSRLTGTGVVRRRAKLCECLFTTPKRLSSCSTRTTGRIAMRFDPLNRWELKYNDGTGPLKARLLWQRKETEFIWDESSRSANTQSS